MPQRSTSPNNKQCLTEPCDWTQCWRYKTDLRKPSGTPGLGFGVPLFQRCNLSQAAQAAAVGLSQLQPPSATAGMKRMQRGGLAGGPAGRMTGLDGRLTDAANGTRVQMVGFVSPVNRSTANSVSVKHTFVGIRVCFTRFSVEQREKVKVLILFYSK